MRIEGAVALVTGASRGIGFALVEGLIARGVSHVYATARTPRVQNGPDGRDRLIPLRMDVTNEPGVLGVAALANDVTLLVNNAGMLTPGGVFDVEAAQIRREMETNCLGLINVARVFAPVIERNGGGVILNVLSISALANAPTIGVYSASKAAAWSATQAMRAELAAKNIQVLAAFPGPVDTDMTRKLQVVKTSAKDVAEAMLDGIEQGMPEIFPDPMSKQAGDIWQKNPKMLERQFAFL
ncbi:MAG: SDR family NAD(P)-dependent oxidoreductase [Beijerinckiaceae bacterium]|nr:SDR family NAD(P)-dependent oxidoreductase [Beijerinckiaceae bacterium]